MNYFKRSDWLYVHTAGKIGTRPDGISASRMFPWGGQAIFRNHFEAKDGLWMWMDVGPYGSSGHAHASKNAINLRAWGTMLLVDSGRFQYNGQGLSEQLNRQYERTTTAHNTLTFDSKQQQYQPALAKAPVENSSWSFSATSDFVRGHMSLYEGLQGTVTHQRGTLLQKVSTAGLPQYIVVVDKVTTDRSRTVQASWHAHPKSTVKFYDGGVATITGVWTASALPAPTMLSVIPSSEFTWANATVVRGQKGNASLGIPWQGWYSSNYNGNSTAPTLVYDGVVPKAGAVFGWLLVPQKNDSTSMPLASLHLNASDAGGNITASVSIGDRQEIVSLDLGPAPPPPPPCPANGERICGKCIEWPTALRCEKGERVDYLLATGDDGSCSCDEYCATDWSRAAQKNRPRWTGATSAFGTNSAPFQCPDSTRLMCVCVQATHFCPKIPHLCKDGCNKLGVPTAKDFCVPS